MDLVDGVVILGSVWSLIGGVYLYITFTSEKNMQLEQFKQENITLRKDIKPREWWQDAVVEFLKHPEYVEKLLPVVGNTNLQGLIQQFLTKK